jgi:dihydrofolate reductase
MISLVLARNQDGVIGVNGELPWHLPEDLAHFKKLTWGHTVVMGRKTYESIGCKPLPGRNNIIMRHGVDINVDDDNVYVIGGAQIYKHYLPLANTIYETMVETIEPFENATCFDDDFEKAGFRMTEWSEWKQHTPQLRYQFRIWHKI